MVTNKQIDLVGIVQKILKLDTKMRFAAIISPTGIIREAIMMGGKTNLKSQKEEEHFCQQVAQRRSMRKEFDRSLGKVRYVHVEREKVSQMVIYTKRNIVYFTMEPEMPIDTKVRLITKVKKITSAL
jgi:LPS sulfotransferase NodH